ncbi:unnamed protein product [Ostreobium quekettii]|uniref:Uncharacterized protein n=1 Tax=Ostreobium quekettii TaxID=121088 RepID=A0A8S1JFC6_9CHLO|nr:unnamed protein product [Ostreobium quekettii]
MPIGWESGVACMCLQASTVLSSRSVHFWMLVPLARGMAEMHWYELSTIDANIEWMCRVILDHFDAKTLGVCRLLSNGPLGMSNVEGIFMIWLMLFPCAPRMSQCWYVWSSFVQILGPFFGKRGLEGIVTGGACVPES